MKWAIQGVPNLPQEALVSPHFQERKAQEVV